MKKRLKRKLKEARMNAMYALFHRDYYQKHGTYLHNQSDLNIRKFRDRELSQQS
jgi:hypothetical protein